MSGRIAFTATITLIAVLASSAVVVTAPQMWASRRVNQRFSQLAPDAPEPIPGVRLRSAVERIIATRAMAPLRALLDGGHRRRVDRRIPDALDRVVRHLRSGSTLTSALRHVGEDDPVFERIASELRAGQSLRDAVGEWGNQDDLPNRRLTATALDLASSAGGASARVLDGVAASLRDRIALEREVAALSSQSRASAVVLVVAPVAFAMAAAMFDARLLDTLLRTPIGWVCLGLGLGLDGLGAVWMSKLIGRHR